MNKPSRHRQGGFTLIELVTVIVILGLLSAVALPKLTDLGKDARVAKMQGALSAARNAYAMATGKWAIRGGSSITTDDGSSIPFVDKASSSPACGTTAQSCGCVPSPMGMVRLLTLRGGTYPSSISMTCPSNGTCGTSDSWAYYAGAVFAFFGINDGNIKVPSNPTGAINPNLPAFIPQYTITCGFTYTPPTSCTATADPFYSNFSGC